MVFLVVLGVVAMRRDDTSTSASASAWAWPAAAALLFLMFSLGTVVLEGPLGFWVEHTRNLWGNQVWLDLLLTMAVAWGFVWPHARRLGMSPWPWLMLIVCTGSVGLLALVARIGWLRMSLPDRGTDR